MIIGIITFGANRQKKLPRCFADSAHPEVGAAQRVGRFPILQIEPLRCPPMFDRCFRLPVLPEKRGKDVLRRDRLRIVPDELVVDLLDTQPLFCRYVRTRERLRRLMGRPDLYPRFYRRTNGLRTREHRRKKQNEQCGGSYLAFTPAAVCLEIERWSFFGRWRLEFGVFLYRAGGSVWGFALARFSKPKRSLSVEKTSVASLVRT